MTYPSSGPVTISQLATRLSCGEDDVRTTAHRLGITLGLEVHPAIATVIADAISHRRSDPADDRRAGDAAPTVDNGGTGSTAAPTIDRGADSRRSGEAAPTVDAATASTAAAGSLLHMHVDLPAIWAAEFDVPVGIGRGSQADIYRVRRHADGTPMVVKVYRTAAERFEQVRALLPRLRDSCMVQIDRLEYLGGVWWELQEYIAGGTLADIEPRSLKTEEVVVLVHRMAAALDHLHELGIVHRDVKPGNIMLRSRNPFTPVLGDLGLALYMDATREYGSGSGTPPYAPPENRDGLVTQAFDWWSLGMVLVEHLSGRHPLRNKNGTWMAPRAMEDALLRNVIEIPSSIRGRVRWLCEGLLTPSHEDRWGGKQVKAWLAGESPNIKRRPLIAAAPPPEVGGRATARVIIDSKTYKTVASLAASFATDPRPALRALKGRSTKARDFTQLRIFFGALKRSDLVTAMDTEPDSYGGVADLIARMSNEIPPTYQGRDISVAGLTALIDEAREKPDSRTLLLDLHSSNALSAFASDSRPGGAGLALIDDEWRHGVERFRAVWPKADQETRAAAVIALLRATIAPTYAASVRAEAKAALADATLRTVEPFGEIAQRAEANLGTADALAVTLAAPPARAKIAEKKAAEAARHRAAEKQRAEEAARRRLERAAAEDQRRVRALRAHRKSAITRAWISVVFGVIAVACTVWYSAMQDGDDPAGPHRVLSEVEPWFIGIFRRLIQGYWFMPGGEAAAANFMIGSQGQEVAAIVILVVAVVVSVALGPKIPAAGTAASGVVNSIINTTLVASIAAFVFMLPVLIVGLLYLVTGVLGIAIVIGVVALILYSFFSS